MPFCPDDFPRQYKRRCNAFFSSLFTWPIPAADRPPSTWESTFNIWRHCSFRRPFLHSFPPMTNWTLNFQAEWLIPAQLFTTVLLLLFVRLTVQGDFVSTEIKVFATLKYFSSTHLFLLFLIYVVTTISFQTFFVQAFKIVDSWNFTMLLLYILWDY